MSSSSSYQVIARKWRPQTFDEVTGQSHVTTPLRNAIRTGRVPHAVLLTGPRGTGKTTLARILAKCLNCEKGPTESPCGVCPSCVEIAGGSSTDVQEIDAASRTSVDDVRELIEAIRYAAAPGRHKIFVVDEVHMLSTAAFNALLKTLEEPPPRSLFVFATTNPEKIPFTVISRCQRYDLRRIARTEVAARLAEIAAAEGIGVSESSLLAMAREGDGSMRDSQTLMDQIIAYGGSEISDETVAEVLDLTDRSILLGILEACVDSDAAAALEACGRAAESGVEAKRLAADLVQLLRDLVVLRLAPESRSLVEGADEEIAELHSLAERSEPARLRRMFRALVKEQEDLGWAPQPFAVLEMAIVRLATLPAGDDVARLLTRLDALERKLAGAGSGGGSSGGPTGTGGGSGASGAGRAREGAPRSRPPRSRADGDGERGDRTAPAHDDAAVPVASEPAPPTPSPDAPPALVFDRLRGFAQDRNRGLFAALDGGRIVERSDGRLQIAVSGSFQAKRLRDRLPELEAVCGEFFGGDMRVEICEETEVDSSAPVVPDARNRREEARQLRQAALKHPAVNTALKGLQGEIVDIVPLRERPSQ